MLLADELPPVTFVAACPLFFAIFLAVRSLSLVLVGSIGLTTGAGGGGGTGGGGGAAAGFEKHIINLGFCIGTKTAYCLAPPDKGFYQS